MANPNDGSNEEEDSTVFLTDAQGSRDLYQILSTLLIDEQQYRVLTPFEAYKNDEDESMEIFIFRYDVDAEGDTFYEDEIGEEDFAKVQAEFEAISAAMNDDTMVVITDDKGNDRRFHLLLIIPWGAKEYALLKSTDKGARISVSHYQVEKDGTKIFSNDLSALTHARVKARAEVIFARIEAAGRTDN